jgi:hypothetical protein
MTLLSQYCRRAASKVRNVMSRILMLVALVLGTLPGLHVVSDAGEQPAQLRTSR